jgi:hypothetical protein
MFKNAFSACGEEMIALTREQIIRQAAKEWADKEYGDNGSFEFDDAFVRGALWADEHPVAALVTLTNGQGIEIRVTGSEPESK